MTEPTCKKCKKRPIYAARSGSLCRVCRENSRIWKSNVRNKLISNGVCPLCRKAPKLDNITLCSACRTKERSRLLEYKAKNRERLREENKTYREKNKEKERARIKDWGARNPDKVVASRKRRHYVRDMLEKGAAGYFSADDWRNILTKYGEKCLWCNREEPEIKLTIDHIVPLNRRGTNNPDNLQPLCVSCNSKKKTKTIDFRPFGSMIMEWT